MKERYSEMADRDNKSVGWNVKIIQWLVSFVLPMIFIDIGHFEDGQSCNTI